MTHPAVFRPLQARFLSIPQAPLCYWLRERFFELLAGKTIGEAADLVQQLITADNNRFLRFVWEVRIPSERWLRYLKGGGYARWFGYEQWYAHWYSDGACIKANILEKYPYLNGNWGWLVKVDTFFKDGWTYCNTVRGCLGARRLTKDYVCDSKSPSLLPREDLQGLGAILNSHITSYLLRSLSASLDFRESYVARLPLPQRVSDVLLKLEHACINLKSWLVALDPTERSFGGIPVAGASLAEAWCRLSGESEAVAAVMHTLEGLSEREVFQAYRIEADDLQAVLDETGTPAGWFSPVAGYNAIPDLPQGLEVPGEILAPFSPEPHRTLSAAKLSDLKRRLRALYEASPGAKVEEDEPTGGDESDEEESEATVSGARIPIPAETFLEELSQKIEIHPISVYWLLRELRDNDGVVCPPELRRFAEDYVSITVLRLLGHRWPRKIEAGQPMPPWADCDGIVPLTEGTGEPTLLARLRERIAADFGAEQVSAIERELEEIVGKPLGTWLASDFFRRHISQFRKRPIAWQLTSGAWGRGSGVGGRKRTPGPRHLAPAFTCLVYYHRVDADFLPKLRSQYVGPLWSRFQTELAGLEKVRERTAEQDAQRVQLEAKIEELKAFDARIEEVIVRGFDCTALAESVAREPTDRWTFRDGTSAHPSTRDAFLVQESTYAPDLNDGVRVNVAPLQKAGLLAADVLAPKDVEKAISDRAEWRADERRWCREGKLPRPGWWPEGAR